MIKNEYFCENKTINTSTENNSISNIASLTPGEYVYFGKLGMQEKEKNSLFLGEAIRIIQKRLPIIR